MWIVKKKKNAHLKKIILLLSTGQDFFFFQKTLPVIQKDKSGCGNSGRRSLRNNNLHKNYANFKGKLVNKHKYLTC